ncbi:hypothetical protein KAR52_03340 [Candidatus Pacearchaeota archaeon]|nr:hypothetical protein [Candidatus Pacearchaeota archaeon]
MVINKNSMGHDLNKKMRKKLIYLYEEYIKNPKDKFIQEGSWDLVSGDDFFFTEAVSIAGNVSLHIYEGTLKVEEAKKILEELKKEEEEDKN